jgi:hypothetical protein
MFTKRCVREGSRIPEESATSSDQEREEYQEKDGGFRLKETFHN